MLLYEITPWHQLLHAFGPVSAARHVQQQCIDVLEHIQIIRFCSLNETVYDTGCHRPVHGGMEQEIFPSDGIALGIPLCTVVGKLAASVLEVALQGVLMVQGIVYRLLKLASACRVLRPKPPEEVFPDGNFLLHAFLLPFFWGQFPEFPLQVEEFVEIGSPYFSRDVFLQVFLWDFRLPDRFR